MEFAEIVKNIPKQEQRQDALIGQLNDLCLVAVRLGMYDGADYLRQVIHSRRD